jgi:hypothetical protein
LVCVGGCVGAAPPSPSQDGQLTGSTSGTSASEPGSSSGGVDEGVTGDTAQASTGSMGMTTTAVGTDDGSSSTSGRPVDPCDDPAPFVIELDVTQALLAAPMQLGKDASEGTYAYSEVAGQGRASFELQVPCETEVLAWGRVYDPGVGVDGLESSQPDSFLVAFDDDADTEWWYYCQMTDAALSGGAWSWEQLMDNSYCESAEFSRTLSPGTHLLHVTNLEPGSHATGEIAAVARVVLTNDPTYVP